MLKFIAATILCILIHPLWAQEVSNVQVQQNGAAKVISCSEYLIPNADDIDLSSSKGSGNSNHPSTLNFPL